MIRVDNVTNIDIDVDVNIGLPHANFKVDAFVGINADAVIKVRVNIQMT